MQATRAYSPAEQQLMLQAMPTARDRLLFLAGLVTGFRIHELLSIRVRDVWCDGGPATELTVNRQRLKGGAGEMRRRVRSRTVPLNPVFRATVQVYFHEVYGPVEPSADHFVFQSRKGENAPITSVQAWRIIKTAARSCLSDASRIATHSGRKTFARSVYDNSGHDIILTQKALGHRSIFTTSLYLESTDDEATEAIKGIVCPSPILCEPVAEANVPPQVTPFQRASA